MKRGWLIFSCAVCLCLSGCAAGSGGGDKPALPQPEQTAGRAPGKSAAQLVPDRLEKNESGVPMLKVYDVKNEKLETLSVEDYLPAVLAGEMAGDWPLEALKAQAILARIREAVKETRGEVLNAGGELPYAWFHAHSGGLTARAKEGLDYEKAEPGYTQCVKGMENDEAPAEAAHWQASFSMDEVMAAAKASGVTVDKVESIAIGQRGESGRAKTLLISGKSVSAPAFRIAIGSTKMRSCLLESLRVEDGQVQMSGKGYGHGVGMSQWGAYAMAKEGRTAEEIVTHYFNGVSIDQAWE